ncbi:MAG: PhzF family phenazine biosynthesis protein [Candidatus Obscuribacterales bacterium]|nr:PhzF family phenazine biosynthesis protein [Candidatus Obscuribacterales bacterium]
MSIFLVDAFTNERFAGNRAGVVLDPEGYSKDTKQKIAAELNAPETVFAYKIGIDLYRAEYFTPSTEIEFCGHATIALFYTLAKLGKIGSSSNGTSHATIETKAGTFPITVSKGDDDDFIVTMRQTTSEFATPPCTVEQAASALRLPKAAIDPKYPIGLARTGNWHLIICLKNQDFLHEIDYDSAALSEILEAANAVTAHVFCAGNAGTYHARNFGPTIGIPEDPATGSAAGAFAAYLVREGLIPDGDHKIEIVQGEKMGRVSHIWLRIVCADRVLQQVEISGSAVISFQLISAPVLVAAP